MNSDQGDQANLIVGSSPALDDNDGDDALKSEQEYDAMRRSLSAPPRKSTVGPPVLPATTTVTSSATMPIMSTAFLGHPYSQGVNVSTRILGSQVINWILISTQ